MLRTASDMPFSKRPLRRSPALALAVLIPLLGRVATSAPPAGVLPPPPVSPPAAAAVPSVPEPPPSVESLRQQRDELASRKDLDEPTRAAALAAIDRAVQRASAIAEWADRRTRSEQSRQSLATEVEQAKAELAAGRSAGQAPSGHAPELDAALAEQTPAALAQQQDEAEAALKLARDRLVELDRELQQRSDRRAALPAELASATAELEDLSRPAAAAAAVAETHPAIAAATRADRAMRIAELQASLAALRAESSALQERTELDALRRERATQRIAGREAELQLAKARVERRTSLAAEQEALAARRDAADGAAPVRAVAQRTLELVELRSGPGGLIALNNTTRARLQRLVERFPVLTAEYERERLRAASSGNSGLTTARLRLQRAQLPDARALEAALSRARDDLFTTQREHAELDAEVAALPSPETQRDDLIAELERSASAPLPAALRSEISAELDRRIAEQRRQFELLQAAYAERTEMLLKAIEWVPPAIALTKQFSAFIDRRILWIRSVEPIGARDPSRVWESLERLGERFREAVDERQLRRAAEAEAPWLWTTALVAAGWVASRRWRRRRFDAWDEQTSRISTDGMMPTIKATFLTAAEAIAWPGLMLFALHRISLVVEPGSALETAVFAIHRAMLAALVFTPLLAVVRTHGLAQSHFRWRDETRRLLRRTLRVSALIILPLVAIVAATEWDTKDAGADALGRCAFIVACIVFATSLGVLLSPKRGVLAPRYAAARDGWTRRLVPLWRLVSVAAPLAVALLAALGWYYTAIELERRIVSTTQFALALVVANALVTRWLLLTRRRLALAEMRREREARAAEAAARATREAIAKAAATPEIAGVAGATLGDAVANVDHEALRESGQASSAEGGSVPVDDDSVDIQSVDAQSRKLLRAAVTFALLLGLWAIWAAVLPALGGLNRFELWPNFGQVRESSDLPPSAREILAKYGRGAESLAGLASWPVGGTPDSLFAPSRSSTTAASTSGTTGSSMAASPAPSLAPSAAPSSAASAAGGAAGGAAGAQTPPRTVAEPPAASAVQPPPAPPAAAVDAPPAAPPATSPAPSPAPTSPLASGLAPSSIAASDGADSPGTDADALTLGNLFGAILILVATIMVARNITGLLELVILQRLPIENSVRYATTTLIRYLVWGVGLTAAFGAVGIGWSKVQWLVAAVSVGIGFGLQEIVANFICGIIILFERPIRVGDTVTIGGVSGTVSRIRIRATTITDWDRKELIIPNKSIITSEVLNWTLSDANLRLVVPVGVDYAADPELVARLLREVADATPLIVKSPPPNAVFVGFGDSTLNFELRCILPSIEHLVGARHALHMAITKTFRENGISIAFPQRDVHLQGKLEIVRPPTKTRELRPVD